MLRDDVKPSEGSHVSVLFSVPFLSLFCSFPPLSPSFLSLSFRVLSCPFFAPFRPLSSSFVLFVFYLSFFCFSTEGLRWRQEVGPLRGGQTPAARSSIAECVCSGADAASPEIARVAIGCRVMEFVQPFRLRRSLDEEQGTISTSSQPVLWRTDESNAICQCEGAVAWAVPPPVSRRQVCPESPLAAGFC